ncbi:DUF2809 domain-containing protein [Agreia pratensis]|uniref:DUF2809 domain-containing protein n=1 Tax=Agreia pratensis TaxID=150121 RepID=A0A1X7KRN6_9MICO|nr:DUF2809 domain-containing protein [Agreia pratensis]MBF4635679.1 DUF2809 domain-containing protein [Agreia pratensis]SMG43474.1 Protein of unknown function [Agreia pratensis]
MKRRVTLVIAACAVVATGLFVHALDGEVAAFVSDSLYTVLVYLILRMVFVRARLVWPALAAFAFSAMIEVLQLSGLPEQWGNAFPPARLVLGASFSAMDLVAYALGALVIGLADLVVLRTVESRASRSARPPA